MLTEVPFNSALDKLWSLKSRVNQIYNNTISNSINAIEVHDGSFNNKLYNNTIIKSTHGISASRSMQPVYNLLQYNKVKSKLTSIDQGHTDWKF